jgi:hypothetical protein
VCCAFRSDGGGGVSARCKAAAMPRDENLLRFFILLGGPAGKSHRRWISVAAAWSMTTGGFREAGRHPHSESGRQSLRDLLVIS